MNNPNPLLPQGSLPGKTKSKANFRIAVSTILAIHVVLLGGLLAQGGCSKKKEDQTAITKTNETAFPPLAKTNDYYPANPVPETNQHQVAVVTNPPVVEPPTQKQNETPTAAASEYTVVKGDYFEKIAKARGVSVKALAEANPGVDSRKLQVGQKLQIPGAATPSTHAAVAGKADTGDAAEATYVVKAGDSLTKIATKNGTTIRALRSANNLKTDQIKVGQKLKIPTAKTAAKSITPIASSNSPSGVATP